MGISSSTLGTLTDDEIRQVKASWKHIMESSEETGIFIFKTFLEKHNYYRFFRKFAAVPVIELTENKSFKTHANAIMRSIDSFVFPESIPEVSAKLVELGKFHKARSVTEKQFKELKAVIMDTFEHKFKLQVETLTAWNKAFDIAYGYLFQGLSPD